MLHSRLQIREQTREGESGFVLLAVIFLTVVLLISLAVAAPKIARSIQRDKEMETIHRGEQYKRAIKLYYQKFGSYPTSIDQLVETNQIRFLRRKYKDPLTGKDDWKPVFFGQAHVRPLGFFGQPLMTVGLAGTASMYAAAASTTTDANGVPIASPDQSGTTGASGAAGSSGFGTNSGLGSSGSGFGSSGSGFGSSGSTFGSSGSSFGSSPATGSSTFGSSSSTTTPGSTTTSPFGSSGSGTSATTFGGGGPIVGFTLPVDKPSLIEYKMQKRYNKWEFNYDPMEDQAMGITGMGGSGTATLPSNPNSSFGGNNSSFGGNSSSFGGSNNGSSNGTGIPVSPPQTPTAPTDPTSPQQ
jgi:type II secretory pathway pseudopilin PulG